MLSRILGTLGQPSSSEPSAASVLDQLLLRVASTKSYCEALDAYRFPFSKGEWKTEYALRTIRKWATYLEKAKETLEAEKNRDILIWTIQEPNLACASLSSNKAKQRSRLMDASDLTDDDNSVLTAIQYFAAPCCCWDNKVKRSASEHDEECFRSAWDALKTSLCDGGNTDSGGNTASEQLAARVPIFLKQFADVWNQKSYLPNLPEETSYNVASFKNEVLVDSYAQFISTSCEVLEMLFTKFPPGDKDLLKPFHNIQKMSKALQARQHTQDEPFDNASSLAIVLPQSLRAVAEDPIQREAVTLSPTTIPEDVYKYFTEVADDDSAIAAPQGDVNWGASHSCHTYAADANMKWMSVLPKAIRRSKECASAEALGLGLLHTFAGMQRAGRAFRSGHEISSVRNDLERVRWLRDNIEGFCDGYTKYLTDEFPKSSFKTLEDLCKLGK